MNFYQLKCPNCNIPLNNSLDYHIENKTINLDQIYYYDIFSFICPICKEQIIMFNRDIPQLWLKKEQFCYNKFVSNKNKKLISNKKYLYFYFPIYSQNIINIVKKNIDFSIIDVLIIPEMFKQFFSWNKQLCILPKYLFEPNFDNIFPNYFIQKIILNQYMKFTDSILYSTYYTFFNDFKLIYNVNNWNMIQKLLK